MLDIRYILLHTATTSAFTTTIIMRLPPLADQQKAAVLPNSAQVRKDLWTYRILFRTWKNRELLPWHYSIGYLHIFWKIGKLGPVTKLSSKEMHLIADDIFLLY